MLTESTHLLFMMQALHVVLAQVEALGEVSLRRDALLELLRGREGQAATQSSAAGLISESLVSSFAGVPGQACAP
jgi:hypothetical protein